MSRKYCRHALITSFLLVLWGCGGGSSSGGVNPTTPVQTVSGLPIDGEVNISYGADYNVSGTISINGGVQEAISSSFDPNGDAIQTLSTASAAVVGATMVTGDSRLCAVLAQNVGNQLVTDPLSEIPLFQPGSNAQLVSQNDIIGTDSRIFATEQTISTFINEVVPATQLSNLYFFSAEQTTLGFGLAIIFTCASPTVTFGQFGSEFRDIFSTVQIR